MEDPIADFISWYTTRPILTRILTTTSLIFALLLTLDLVDIHSIYYAYEQTYPTLELWRPITAALYMGKLDLALIFNLYFAYFALIRAERGLFQKDEEGDFIWLLSYLFVGMTLAGAVINIYFTGKGVLFALIYVWCKRKPF